MVYPKKSGGFGEKRRGGFGGNGGRPSFGGGRSNYGGGRPSFGRDRNDGPKEMFQATCAKCQRSCEVPFRPTGEKPVYCSDCFGTQRGDSNDRGGRREERREDRGSRDRFPKREFTPSFASKPAVEDKRIDALKRQLDVLSVKVDQILAIVSNRQKVSVEIPKKEKREIDKMSISESLKEMMQDVQISETPKKGKKTAKKTEKKTKEKAVKGAGKKVTKRKTSTKKK